MTARLTINILAVPLFDMTLRGEEGGRNSHPRLAGVNGVLPNCSIQSLTWADREAPLLAGWQVGGVERLSIQPSMRAGQ